MLKSLFNNVTAGNFVRKRNRIQHRCSLMNFANLFNQNTYFIEHLWATAFVRSIGSSYFYETEMVLHNLN